MQLLGTYVLHSNTHYSVLEFFIWDELLLVDIVRLRTPGETASLVINCRASSLYKLSQQRDNAYTESTFIEAPRRTT